LNVGDLPARDAKITRRFFDALPVLYLEGHFDFFNIASFEAALHAHARGGGIVSLERMRSADAAVLSALVRLHAQSNGRVVYISPSAVPVARLFTLTEMATHLRLVSSYTQASALAEQLSSDAPGH